MSDWYDSFFEEIRAMQKKIDRISEDFSSKKFLPSISGKEMQKPLSDVRENEKEISFFVDLPGVSKENIEIELKNEGLEIKAQKRIEFKQDKKDYKLIERSYSGYSRFYSLPSNADTDKLVAEYKNGVLSVTIPKKKVMQPKNKKIKLLK